MNTMTKYCMNCGRELNSNQKYCDGCGKKVDEEITTKSNKNIIIIAGIIGVILIICLGVFLLTYNQCNLSITSGSTINAVDGIDVSLTDKDGQGIPNKEIKITLKNNNDTYEFKGKTDNEGKTSITPAVNPGKYDVKCEFDGNDGYSKVSVSKSVTIENGDVKVDTISSTDLESSDSYVSYTPLISFDETDTNGDGYVTLSDMNIAHTPDNIKQQMYSDADEDNDGKLNPSEYKKFMYLMNEDRGRYGLD